METVGESLAAVLKACAREETLTVAHVVGGYRRSCQRAEEILEWSFRYTGGEKPTAPESLKTLSGIVREVDGPFPRRDPLEEPRFVLSYQYDTEAASSLTASPTRARHTRRSVELVGKSGGIARLNPATGLFIPEEQGSRILARLGVHCVDLDFELDTKVLYCPGVLTADSRIRPGDEVVVRRDGKAVGQGRAVVPGREMEESQRGKAVILRELFE